MSYRNDDIENGMVLGNNEPRLSQWDKEWETQDDDRDNQWFDENVRGGEDE